MLRIYGASDDMIVADGGDRLFEQFVAVNGLAYIYLSTGMIVRWTLDDHAWRAAVLDAGADPELISVDADSIGGHIVSTGTPVRWVGVSEQPPVVAA